MTQGAALLPGESLLEAGALPIEELVHLALREGRRPRPIYTAHKWFARRLGVVFRSLLVGATCRPADDFWGAYYGAANLSQLTVLDPFVGGGTSVVEAQRLGASVAARDVDPIACAVTRFELSAHDMPDLKAALHELASTVGVSLRRYHEVEVDGLVLTVVHHFWVQRVKCGECSAEFDAHPNYWLSRMPSCAWAFCKWCGQPQKVADDATTLHCDACDRHTALDEGIVDFGRVTCPDCGHRARLIDLGRAGTAPPRWKLFAHEVLDEPDGGRAVPMSKRRFVPATSSSTARYEEAAAELDRGVGEGTLHLAGGPIVVAAQTDSRLQDYGYQDWLDLYNARQRLHLATLAKAVDHLDSPIRDALVVAFSDHLTTNCMMTSYAAGWRRLTPLFSIRSFRHVPRPVEINPWLDGTGRGTFPNAVRKLLRAREFALSPKEPHANGGFRPVASIKPANLPRVHAGSSTDLAFLAEASIDLVLTDPPYFDNIAYSELAEFFLPWLRHFGTVIDEGVDRVLLDSLVGRRSDQDSVTSYTEGLTAVFGEVSRVLKPGGMMVFSYRHSVPAAWLALAKALAPHALDCVRVLPLPGEAGTGLHAHDGAGLWDAVFVLRRRQLAVGMSRPLLLSASAVEEATRSAERWARTLTSSPIRFGQPDQRTVRMAEAVRATLTGSPPTGGETLASALERLKEGACPD